jgi:hypothetical protein
MFCVRHALYDLVLPLSVAQHYTFQLPQIYRVRLKAHRTNLRHGHSTYEGEWLSVVERAQEAEALFGTIKAYFGFLQLRHD